MSDIFIGIDIGLRGSIVTMNKEGIPLSVFKIPLIYLDRKKNNKNNNIKQDNEEFEIDINKFKISEYRNPKRFIKTQIKKDNKIIEKKVIRKTNTTKKEIIKTIDEWYDADKILEYVRKIKKQNMNSNAKVIIELQNPFFTKNKGGNKLLRGFGLIEGLLISVFGQKSIELVSPITWQKKLFSHYLGDNIINNIKDRNLLKISSTDQYLQNEFPDILAIILSLLKKKSIQTSKILSTYCLYSMYRNLLIDQSYKIHYKEKNSYQIINGFNNVPNKNDLLNDLLIYMTDNNICDAFCLSEYLRLSTLKKI